MTRRPLVPAVLAFLLLAGGAPGGARQQAGEPPSPEAPGREPEPEPCIEEFRDGYIDWGRGVVAAWGRAVQHAGEGRPGRMQRAPQVAEAAARQRLLAIVRSVVATSEFRIGDRPGLLENVSGFLQEGEVIRERDRAQLLEILVAAPVRGEDGLAYSVYGQIAPKENRAAPAPPEGTADPAPAPRSPDGPTGIVIDARGTEVRPALLPRILDGSGRVIASPETVSEAAFRAWGMAAYATQVGEVSPRRDLTGETTSPKEPFPGRRGPRPYLIEAASAAGPLKADIVLDSAEAERLERSPEAMRLLRECRVLVLVAPLTGPVRGDRGQTAPEGDARVRDDDEPGGRFRG